MAAAPEEKEEVAEGDCSKAHKKDEDNLMDENEEVELEEEKKDCKHCRGTGKVDGKDCEHCKKVSENEAVELEEAAGVIPHDRDPEKNCCGICGPGGESKPHQNDKNEKVAESKIQTPEQENVLYESRFGKRNQKIFDKLTELWTK